MGSGHPPSRASPGRRSGTRVLPIARAGGCRPPTHPRPSLGRGTTARVRRLRRVSSSPSALSRDLGVAIARGCLPMRRSPLACAAEEPPRRSDGSGSASRNRTRAPNAPVLSLRRRPIGASRSVQKPVTRAVTRSVSAIVACRCLRSSGARSRRSTSTAARSGITPRGCCSYRRPAVGSPITRAGDHHRSAAGSTPTRAYTTRCSRRSTLGDERAVELAPSCQRRRNLVRL